MRPSLNIENRIRRNAEALMRAPGRKKVRANVVAKRMGMSPSAFSNFLAGRQSTTFAKLEALAEGLGVSPAELVKRDEETIYALSGDEAELLRYVRRWTDEARRAAVALLRYLHAALPDDDQTIQMFQHWSRLKQFQRALVLSTALRQLDEELPREVRVTLGIPESDEGTPRTKGKGRGQQRRDGE
jgi:transcriptional regulator with XRE-family HTH domain